MIKFRCRKCDFSYQDKNLIFYLKTEKIKESFRETNKESNNEDYKESNKKDNTAENKIRMPIINKIQDSDDNINLTLIEECLNKEVSDKMNNSLISGFIYESYCPECNELIKTYVPEKNKVFTNTEIKRILLKLIRENNTNKQNKTNKEPKNIKIIFLDFDNTTYKDRRIILKNNKCPNCNEKMSLLIDKETPCPKCRNKLIEEIQ